MVPWGILSGLNGDLKLGLAIIGLWIIMSVTRQFIEPKIVSRKYWNSSYFLQLLQCIPVLSLLEFCGMFVGPIVLIILKNVFSKFF